jgi:hypothetical protein
VNHRGFISLLTGAAGAALVPWRGNVEPLISLPPRTDLSRYFAGPDTWFPLWNFSNSLSPESYITQQSLEEMLETIWTNTAKRMNLRPTQLIVSPQVKHLIDTDPVVHRTAEMALGRKL